MFLLAVEVAYEVRIVKLEELRACLARPNHKDVSPKFYFPMNFCSFFGCKLLTKIPRITTQKVGQSLGPILTSMERIFVGNKTTF